LGNCTASPIETPREQARIQREGRSTGTPTFELLLIEPGYGLCRLPAPSPGDIFLDFEGDPFSGEHGQEYLFGYCLLEDEEPKYTGSWALTREAEKQAFETFVDMVMARWSAHPDLHIYHYAPYEPAALKRLMGRYATREEEVDRMLRAKLFVDLYGVVRHAVRASVESYSIKQLEPFYGFSRQMPLSDANAALALLQANLELGNVASIPEETKATVLSYNKDDCISAARLRTWLESLRAEVAAGGTDVPRPTPGEDEATGKITDWLLKIGALAERLTAKIPIDPAARNGEQQAQWILANILDWHRREQKAVWWEHFRLADLSADELREERAALSGLRFLKAVGGTTSAPVHRYAFPAQETELRGGEDLRRIGGERLGSVEAISAENRTVDIKKRRDSAGVHAEAVYAHTVIDPQILANSLVRTGEHVAKRGINGAGAHRAARDLLLRAEPRCAGQPLRRMGESVVDAAVRLCAHLEPGVLPIQGPPGAGKTFTGARMICEVVRRGKKVGVTANSHKVIRHLIDKTFEAAAKQGLRLSCCQKTDEVEQPQAGLAFAKTNKALLEALDSGTPVAGGTPWLWASEEARDAVDVLFVDEAAQMSLANVLAVSQAAKTVVLIGDPQQLDQPMQGSHPEGTDVSALTHILGDAPTMAADRGLFLEETWRLHPSICAFTSELFYAGQLKSRAGLEQQAVLAKGPIGGAGLRYLPVRHVGNQNCSPEEAEAVAKLVTGLLESKAEWRDSEGKRRTVRLQDILIVTPYNAQVFEIQERLPGALVGTVDKFQGQEAPIAIYSTATSSHADAPRGMEFLYSLNRFNVATSRAQCISILVSSPQIFEAECRTPRQIHLANAFCRYLELAKLVA
jgi:hypothetical protein